MAAGYFDLVRNTLIAIEIILGIKMPSMSILLYFDRRLIIEAFCDDGLAKIYIPA